MKAYFRKEEFFMENVRKEYSFPSHTGNTDIFVQSLAPADGNVKAVIQIVHGMAEHTDRYLDVANYLCERGFAVIMHDHAGHGRSVKSDDDNGYFCDKDGWMRLTEDIYEVTKLAKQNFPGVKVIIWGHSMGSFLTRLYIAKYKKATDAAIICGTSGANPAAGAGIFLANTIAKVKGAKYRSKFIDIIAFGQYNKHFSGGTGFEWLSVNEENVAKYVADPKCGFLFSASAFCDLFHMLKAVSEDKWFSDVPADEKIYLISGTMDPVGNYGEGVKEVFEKLKATGHTNVSMKLYEGLRHEIHNELTDNEVYNDIATFAESVL